MKKDIHPEDYRFVVFKDMSNEYTFLGKSTAGSDETIKWEDGNEYPLIKLEISYKSLSPEAAEAVVTAVVDSYLAFMEQYHRNVAQVYAHRILERICGR